MATHVRLIAFAVVLLVGAGVALKHRLVPVSALPESVDQITEAAGQTASHLEAQGAQIGQQVHQQVSQQVQQTIQSAPPPRAGGMHKCVGRGSTTYTTGDCPPGTQWAEMKGGTVTTMRTPVEAARAASTQRGISNVPNVRELLNDPAEAARMQELKDKRMDAIIDGRQP